MRTCHTSTRPSKLSISSTRARARAAMTYISSSSSSSNQGEYTRRPRPPHHHRPPNTRSYVKNQRPRAPRQRPPSPSPSPSLSRAAERLAPRHPIPSQLYPPPIASSNDRLCSPSIKKSPVQKNVRIERRLPLPRAVVYSLWAFRWHRGSFCCRIQSDIAPTGPGSAGSRSGQSGQSGQRPASAINVVEATRSLGCGWHSVSP